VKIAVLEAAGERGDALGFDDDGARGEGALNAGADGFGTGERNERCGFVGFEQGDAAQGDFAISVGDLMQPIGNGNRKRVGGDGFEKFMNGGAVESIVEGATNFFGIETIETAIDARRSESGDVFGERGQLQKLMGIGARGGDEVGNGVGFFGTSPAQRFGGLCVGVEGEWCVVKEWGAERCDGKRIGMEGNGIKQVHEFEMGADEIFGRVGGVVAFDGDELLRACGVAIEFEEGGKFDVLVGRQFAQDLDEPLGKGLRRPNRMVGKLEFVPAFALGARGLGRERGLKEEPRLGGMRLGEIGCGVKSWHELARGRRDEIGGFAYVMDKAEARGVEFTFFDGSTFFPTSVLVTRAFRVKLVAHRK